MEINFIFSLAAIIISIVIHEVSHGYAAYLMGDPTAKYAGRLTLNPLKHLDTFGSIIVPMISYFLGGFIVGWAKPVPFNPYNLQIKRWGEAIVAGVGPASNILIAVVFGLVIRFVPPENMSVGAIELISFIVVMNIALAVFNLIPIPPLDGSKILLSLFPEMTVSLRQKFEQFGLPLLILFIFFAGAIMYPIIRVVFYLITGASIG